MNIDSNNYKSFTIFVLILVGISTLVVYGASSVLKSYAIEIPFYIETPSIPAVYAILFLVFDKFLWKIPIFKKLGIIISDDFNGKWVGIVKSSYDNFESDIPAELIIKQTATRIKVCGKFNQSKSVSIHENFGLNEVDDKVALFYFFRNEPNYDATKTMAVHEGSTKLVYNPGADSLTGYYYSGRDRNNHGTIEVKRVKKA
ncbi:MAG: hypothetical protein WA082_01820 [Candidatus Moraniibacteriota bacterium]